MSREQVRSAFNKVIDGRASELAESIRYEVDQKLQQAAGKVVIQPMQPEIHLDPKITVEATQVHIDMKPVARALAVLIKATKEADERAEKANAAVLKVLRELVEHQESHIDALKELTKQLKANRESELVGSIDEKGKITVKRK